jgi:hypothetical protein
MDAIELLTRDHRHVEELFGQFRSGFDEERRSSAEGIIRELSSITASTSTSRPRRSSPRSTG